MTTQSVELEPPSRSPSRARIATFAGVVLLAIAAFVLRLHGIGFMLPHNLGPDGAVIRRQVWLMRHSPAPELEDNWSFYPHLVPRLVSLLPDADAQPLTTATIEDHLARASAPYMQVRRVVALLSALLVPVTWLIARRFLDRRCSFFAAALIATSLLHVFFAQQGRPHAPAATFSTIAVLCALLLRARPTLARYCLAGIGCGLAIGTLQSGMAVLFPLGAAHLLRERGGGVRAGAWRILIPLAIVGASIVWLYPFILEPPPSTTVPILELREGTFEFFGHSIFLGMFHGAGFATEWWTMWSFELVTTILALVALVLWYVSAVRRHARARADRARARAAGAGVNTAEAGTSAADASAPARSDDTLWGLGRDAWVVVAYVVPYMLVIGLYGRTYERFLLQIVPFAVVLAGSMLQRTLLVLERHGPRRLVASALALALLTVPTLGAVRFVRLRAKPDSGTLVGRWVSEHVRPNEDRIVIVPVVDLPVFHNEASMQADAKLGWSTPWRGYLSQLEPKTPRLGKHYDMRSMPLGSGEQRRLAMEYPYEYLARTKPDYVMMCAPQGAATEPLRHNLRNVLIKQAQLVFRSPPCATGTPSDVSLLYEDLIAPQHFNWSIGLCHRFCAVGAVIEVYKWGASPALK